MNNKTLDENGSTMTAFRGRAMSASTNMSSSNMHFYFFPFLFGIISSQKMNVGGELYVGEVLAFFYIVMKFGNFTLMKFERRLLGFVFIWFFAQLVSDLINETQFLDALKGTLAPLVFGCTTICLLDYFKSNISRLPAFLLGIACGELIRLQFFPTEYYLFNPWKWGLGGAVLSVFVIWFSFYLKRKSIFMLFGALAVFFVISLRFDGRSMAAFPLFAAIAYTFFGTGKQLRAMRFFTGSWGVVRLLGILLPLLLLLNMGASALFSSSFILSRVSKESAEKYSTQAAGAYGLLLGARSEILISTRAFLDKPLLGHGSWAKDKAGYLTNFEGERNRLGYESLPDDTELDSNSLITAHSVLMGTLVWAGIFGGMFWIFILYSMTKQFLASMRQLPFYYYVGMVGLTWNILFSPLGASLRWSTAVFLGAFWAYVYVKRKSSLGAF